MRLRPSLMQPMRPSSMRSSMCSSMRSSMCSTGYSTENGASKEDQNGVQNGPKDLHRDRYVHWTRYYHYHLHRRRVYRNGPSYWNETGDKNQKGAPPRGCQRKDLHQRSHQDYLCPSWRVRWIHRYGVPTLPTSCMRPSCQLLRSMQYWFFQLLLKCKEMLMCSNSTCFQGIVINDPLEKFKFQVNVNRSNFYKMHLQVNFPSSLYTFIWYFSI